MKLTLPPRLGGGTPQVDTSDNHQLIIIGANGSGKTRFANRLAADLGPKAFRMSALKALYGKEQEDPSENSIDSLYHEVVKNSGIIRDDIKGEFERMLALLINEEMLNLISYKYKRDLEQQGGKNLKLPATRLDKMIRLWQQVFPDNKVLIESGKMLFGRESSENTYSSSKLSAGERAVMYYLGAAMFAPPGAAIFVESPDMFLHPTSIRSLWDRIEQMRSDCVFIYVTHDLSFATTRGEGLTVWVKSCDPIIGEWDYDFLPSAEGINDEVYLAILGARKPVLFIEGDGVNSIDSKLYPLIFKEYTVKSLGGCDKVIESTRTFNSLRDFHNLDAFGIVDRDRRDEGEVEYLRRRKVFVPNVAEIENIFMIEEVVRTVASHFHKDENAVFAQVKKSILRLFEVDLRQQALQHTRHKVKKTVEHRIDGKFSNINKLEEHINDLCQSINPRGQYEEYCRNFRRYVHEGDYASVLMVYNRKTMLSESHVARACGLRRDDKDVYIRAILNILKEDKADAQRIRHAVLQVFGLGE
ncbi:MAG: DUF4435 domain-containing protein [Muribaculaceae bacterium]|nr:DUF4435 domain-containing protein [Muribaculaceae bacterium]